MRRISIPSRKLFLLSVVFFLKLFVVKGQPTVVYTPVITEGLLGPMEVKSAPGDASGRLFIVEKGGTVKIWDGTALLSTPFIDISAISNDGGEQGLLSMAFHPEYATNGYFFLYYSDTDGDITVSRFKVSDNNENIAEPDPDPATPLIEIDKAFTNHNGGHLQFRVENNINYLYFATGDGGGTNDPGNNAQNPASFLGKMIRIDVDAATIEPEIWGLGLRNPFRWSFDRANGDMWIGDVGQGGVEEVNYLEGGTQGANFGWRCFEGSQPTSGVTPACDPPGKIPPILEYDNPTEGRSVVGGYVYRGSITELQGYYLATDFFEQTLWLIQKNGNDFNITTQSGLADYVTSISETENGDLYATRSPSVAGEPADEIVYQITTNTVTPLNLIHFSVAENIGVNDLKWTTSMEQNISRFVVEYSTTGTGYTQAGIVQATNNPNGASYSFRHPFSTNEKTYYRLRIEEADGRTEYSAVITTGNGSGIIRIYPTIVSNSIIQVNSDQRIEEMHVYTIQGQQVFAKNLNNSNGFFSVNLPGLQKGTYIVRLRGKSILKTQRIIIQ